MERSRSSPPAQEMTIPTCNVLASIAILGKDPEGRGGEEKGGGREHSGQANRGATLARLAGKAGYETP